MIRSDALYAGMTGSAPAGIDIAVPVAGFYRTKLRSGSAAGGVRVWFGPPHDPDTGEVLDRSWRWQAEFNGRYVEFDRVWPVCAGEPISETDYRAYVAQAEWARTNAPRSTFANPGKAWDPLSSDEPLPF